MLTQEAMLTLAAELTDAQAHGDAESLAAMAWQLYGAVGEDLAEIARLRAALYAAWDPATGNGVTSPSGSLSGTGGPGRRPGQQGILPVKALSQPAGGTRNGPAPPEGLARERPAALAGPSLSRQRPRSSHCPP